MAQATTNQRKTNEEHKVTDTIHVSRGSSRRKGTENKIKTVKLSKNHFWRQLDIKNQCGRQKEPITDKPKTETARSTKTAINTEAEIGTAKSTTAKKTDNNTENDTTLVEKEIWVSRVDPCECLQKETTQCGALDDDNLVTARGQSQRNNG